MCRVQTLVYKKQYRGLIHDHIDKLVLVLVVVLAVVVMMVAMLLIG